VWAVVAVRMVSVSHLITPTPPPPSPTAHRHSTHQSPLPPLAAGSLPVARETIAEREGHIDALNAIVDRLERDRAAAVAQAAALPRARMVYPSPWRFPVF